MGTLANASVFALLCIEAFASVVVLFASAAALLVWLVLKFLDTAVVVYLLFRDPRSGLEKKDLRYDTLHLKRAGQW